MFNDNVIYDIIHERHRHCRESYLLELRSSREQDEQAKKRHKNACNREIKLQPIMDDNTYHLQEKSEIDLNNPDSIRRIIRKFLWDYVNKTFNESSTAVQFQKYIYDKQVKGKAPSRALRWILARYNRSLKKYVEDYCEEEKNEEEKNEEKEKEEKEEEENNENNENMIIMIIIRKCS
ncbi:hypothetical protein C1646_773938 [Rhizophagus diaphanus]|nr:hypothetical protein C1646_773938 [Rhizophagus diaphanus] [Rhizophagus sp. MUCL 43196]